VRKSIFYQPLAQFYTDKHGDACGELESDVLEMKIAIAE
jgi:hypothetical protein